MSSKNIFAHVFWDFLSYFSFFSNAVMVEKVLWKGFWPKNKNTIVWQQYYCRCSLNTHVSYIKGLHNVIFKYLLAQYECNRLFFYSLQKYFSTFFRSLSFLNLSQLQHPPRKNPSVSTDLSIFYCFFFAGYKKLLILPSTFWTVIFW